MDKRTGLRYAFRIAVGITMLVLLLGNNASAAITITVPDDYAKIQWAIDNATAGDTIEVHSGTYYENVIMNKQLNLTGIGSPVVDAGGSGNAITLSSMAGGSTLEGFTVINAGSGVYVGGYSNEINIIRNNTARLNGRGFDLYQSSHNILSGNNASNNVQGIFKYGGSSNTFTGNNAFNNDEGINLGYGSDNQLKNNIMTDNKYNILLSDTDIMEHAQSIDTSNLVDGKPIYYIMGAIDTVYDSSINAGTFYCINCVNVTVKDMNLSKNGAGVYFFNTIMSRIQNVSTSNNLNGIYLFGSTDNMVNGNHVWNNSNTGIEVMCGYGCEFRCESNKLVNNIVWNNSIGFYLGSGGGTMMDGFTNPDDSILVGNKISYNANWGIYLETIGYAQGYSWADPAYSNISYNTVSNNGNGIYLHSASNTLIGNNVSNNTNTGIYLDSGGWCDDFGCPELDPNDYLYSAGDGHNTLTHNTVSNNGNGINIMYSRSNTLINNSILSNNNGVTLTNSSSNLIYNNYFSNVINADDSGNNIWSTTKTLGTNIVGGSWLGGNYWSNYAGKNTDGDGLGDTLLPYNSSGNIRNGGDYLPLVIPTITKPSISFRNPTPANGAILAQNYAYINTTISDSSTAFIDWNRSLIGWWRFNNESGENPSYFRDSSSWGNNGTCSGVNCPSFTSGKFGNALNFDGINDYVDAGSSASLNITDAITIEAWINPAAAQEKCLDVVSGNYGVISKVSSPASSVNWSWQLRYGAPGGGCYLGYQFNGNPEGSRWVTVKQNLTAGQWYHIVGTFNGTHINSYLNGNLKDTKKISAIKGYRNKLLIGTDGWANLFKGKIDEIRIHMRALSPEEIKASYNAGIYRLYRNFTNLAFGSYNYQAYAQNLAGTVSQTEKRTFNLIATPARIISWGNSKTKNNNLTLTVNKSEVIRFNATANQPITTWRWFKDNVYKSNNYNNFSTSWTAEGSYTIKVNATNANGTSNTITWYVAINPPKIGKGGAPWTGFSTFDHTTEDKGRPGTAMIGLFRDSFNDNDYDWTVSYGNLSVVNGKLKAYGNIAASLSRNIGNHKNVAMFVSINETNLDGMKEFSVRSDTSRNTLDKSYILSVRPDGKQIRIVTRNDTSWIDVNISNWQRKPKETNYCILTAYNSLFKGYCSNRSYTHALSLPAVTSGTNSLYGNGNTIRVGTTFNTTRGTDTTTFDDVAVLELDSNGIIRTTGNLTTSYDAGAGKWVYQFRVNATTPVNTNYTAWYRETNKGVYKQAGGVYKGSNTITISGTKYRNTQVKLRLQGNKTASPEIESIEYIAKNAAQTINIAIPNGGEAWARGATKTIRWNYTGSPGSYVQIELWKAGKYNTTIKSNTSIGSSGSGSYNWLIKSTQPLGTDYKVKIISKSNNKYNDTSNNNFSISIGLY